METKYNLNVEETHNLKNKIREKLHNVREEFALDDLGIEGTIIDIELGKYISKYVIIRIKIYSQLYIPKTYSTTIYYFSISDLMTQLRSIKIDDFIMWA